MEPTENLCCTAFGGSRRLASGRLVDVVRVARNDAEANASIAIFEDETGEIIELDFRGTVEEILARLTPSHPPADESPRGPGRPRLGVVSREVTLLPRHWEWLNGQPGGASVALRKLVEEASKARVSIDRARRARDAAYRFLSHMAGDMPGFEEATRALFAGDAEKFRRSAAGWPGDICDHASQMAEPAFRNG